MAKYNTRNEYESATQICAQCKEEKGACKFVTRSNPKEGSFRTEGNCYKCRYREKKEKYQDRLEGYDKTQRYKEVYTVQGRACLLRNRCKQRAKQYGIPYSLTKQLIIDKLSKGVCEATGIDLHFGEERLHPFAPSIDRIDNSKGYHDNNIQVTCMVYNFCKNEFTDEQVWSFIERAKKNA